MALALWVEETAQKHEWTEGKVHEPLGKEPVVARTGGLEIRAGDWFGQMGGARHRGVFDVKSRVGNEEVFPGPKPAASPSPMGSGSGSLLAS